MSARGISAAVAVLLASTLLSGCKSAEEIEANYKACTDRADHSYEVAKEAAGEDPRRMVGVDLNHSTARTACRDVRDACTSSPYGFECLLGN